MLKAGGRIETGARLAEVTTGSDGAVAGAADGRAGVTERLPAVAVILAAGGFDWDEDLRRAWHPAAQRATAASPGSTGDALRIARALGAGRHAAASLE